MPYALQINDLAVHYGSTIAVDGVTWSAAAGQVTALLGANGAGKTSTIEVCEGYLAPTAGQIRVLGVDPTSDQVELRSRVGVMLQQGGVPSGARPEHALKHMAHMYKYPHNSKDMLELVGLHDVDSTYKEMSGGEQQRLKLALALIGRPELVFLDEPTAGLDAHGKRLVWQIVSRLRDNGVTVILTTHQMEDVEQLADQVILMNRGKIVTTGSPVELIHRHSEPAVEFVTSQPIDLTSLRTALPPECGVETSRSDIGHQYRVTDGQATAVLGAVTSWCSANSIELLQLNTDTGSLEDVFLELTEDAE